MLPPINQRIKDLIYLYTEGNVSEFSKNIGQSSQKMNRLFNVDSRSMKIPGSSGKYPRPSLEILLAITNNYPKVNSDWLNKGEGEMLLSDGESKGNSAKIEELKIIMRLKDEQIAELKKDYQELSAIYYVTAHEFEKLKTDIDKKNMKLS
jgi:hypothetical protein